MGAPPFVHAGEVFSLLAALVWAGAVILYNEDHAFLVGVKNPADGWVKVPDTRTRGGAA